MDEYVVKDGKKLRLGVTTGSCAQGATKAAALMLVMAENINEITVITPSQKEIKLQICDIIRNDNSVSCAVVKDAGDDPDVTDGIKICSHVAYNNVKTALVLGGEGVGIVTKPGLSVKVGDAAINPVPLKMIRQELESIIADYDLEKGLTATISVPLGAEIAKKTFNPRIGIVGGISIIGTTGIVEPMSEKALIDTIKLEIDTVTNKDRLVIAFGNYGLEFIKNKIGAMPIIKCSNFIGEAIDYALFCGFKHIVLIGHQGKMVKLAGGIMNTHSRIADCRMEILAAHAAMAGANSRQIKKIMQEITVDGALSLIEGYGLDISETLRERISFHINERVYRSISVDFIVFNNKEEILLMSDKNLLKQLAGET